jgi:hypothetical protein
MYARHSYLSAWRRSTTKHCMRPSRTDPRPSSIQ